MMVKKKSKTSWKPGKVISIRLRNGVLMFANGAEIPHLVFFNHFNEEKYLEGGPERGGYPFCKAVTRQFLRYSPVAISKKLTPCSGLWTPKEWIYSHNGGQSLLTVSAKGRERQVVVGRRCSRILCG